MAKQWVIEVEFDGPEPVPTGITVGGPYKNEERAEARCQRTYKQMPESSVLCFVLRSPVKPVIGFIDPPVDDDEDEEC